MDPTQLIDEMRAMIPEAAAYLEMGRIDDCIRVLDHTMEIKKQALLHVLQGKQHAGQRKYASAKEEFSQALALDPHSDSYASRANAILHLGNAKAALHDANRAIALDQTHAWGWSLRGRCLFELQDFVRAREAFDQAAQLNPDCFEFRYARCETLLQLGEYDAALQDAVKLVEMDPQNSQGWQMKGRSHNGGGQVRQAISACDVALSLNPRDVLALHCRCEARIALQDFDGALRDAECILRQLPADPKALLLKGRCHFGLGDSSKAEAAWARLRSHLDAEGMDKENIDALLYFVK